MEFKPFEAVRNIQRRSNKVPAAQLWQFGSNGEISRHLKSCWASNAHLFSKHKWKPRAWICQIRRNITLCLSLDSSGTTNFQPQYFWGPKFKSTRIQANKPKPRYWSVYKIRTQLGKLDKILWHVFINCRTNVSQILFLEFVSEKIAKRRPQISHDFDQMTWNGFSHNICEISSKRNEVFANANGLIPCR